jgi:glyoxylate/hydroxypyruvate reductase A
VVAQRVAGAGFPVTGWSRTPREIAGIRCRTGREGLGALLAQSMVVVNVLPLTPQTLGILDVRAFAAMPRGACVVNIGRGAHVVDRDLLQALDAGHLGGAMLDVFETEPLPPDHPFWGHPKILVTPHVAAVTAASEALAQVIENVRRLERGESPSGLVDRARGY